MFMILIFLLQNDVFIIRTMMVSHYKWQFNNSTSLCDLLQVKESFFPLKHETTLSDYFKCKYVNVLYVISTYTVKETVPLDPPDKVWLFLIQLHITFKIYEHNMDYFELTPSNLHITFIMLRTLSLIVGFRSENV